MEQYIPKAALVAEIERRIKIHHDYGHYNAEQEFTKVLSFLDTLEVKEVDFSKCYHEFLQREWFGNPHVRTFSEMMAFTAKYFFELGIKAKAKNIWHDANKEEPKIGKAFATIDSKGVMCAEYHVFEGGLTFKQIKEMDDIVKWAYTEDLIPKD